MSLLEIKDLAFEAGGRRLLDGLELQVEKGEVHALLGTNGTGKSTLAYLIMGAEGYAPLRGEVLFDGIVINQLRIHERAAMGITLAWQEPVRFEGISIKDYLTLKNPDLDARPFLELAGLSPELYLDRQVDRSLSGGERKRVELASVLALAPRLAVLDEPDSGIDMLSTRDIINVIRAFSGRGAAVLLITHRQEIASMADRASLLCFGRIICSGDPGKVAELFKSRKCMECFKGECIYV